MEQVMNQFGYLMNKKPLLTSVLQDCGFSAFLEAFVLNQSLGIFRSFSAKSPQPRKALGRYGKCFLNARHKRKFGKKNPKLT